MPFPSPSKRSIYPRNIESLARRCGLRATFRRGEWSIESPRGVPCITGDGRHVHTWLQGYRRCVEDTGGGGAH